MIPRNARRPEVNTPSRSTRKRVPGRANTCSASASWTRRTFPRVTLQCQHLTGGPGQISAELSVILRDHASRLSVPVKWQRNGNTLQAEGEFTFTQTSLGLQPYSLLFGALRVRDEIRARFRLVARAT